jgi:hypothetical protein
MLSLLAMVGNGLLLIRSDPIPAAAAVARD